MNSYVFGESKFCVDFQLFLTLPLSRVNSKFICLAPCLFIKLSFVNVHSSLSFKVELFEAINFTSSLRS